MTTIQPALRSVPRVRTVLIVASVLMIGAAVLYASGLSRATAVAILPFALCLFAASGYARLRRRWPARVWLVLFTALVIAALAYGVWLFIYGLTHPPVMV